VVVGWAAAAPATPVRARRLRSAERMVLVLP
jgi:hypothetical protein